MNVTLFVRPSVEGAVIPDALKCPLPATGKEVPRNAYWLGLLARGDVVEVEPPNESKPEAAAVDKPSLKNPKEV